MIPTSHQRTGGAALIVAACGTVIAMGHHPSSAHSGALGPIVHSAMILFVTLNAFGFALMASGRGMARPVILAGVISYAISVFAHIGAATINGFVVPALAARGGGEVSHDILLLAWETNQALARLGVIATGLSFLLWSLDFLIDRGRTAKLLGIAGIVAGGLPTVLLLGGFIHMNVPGAFLSYAVQAAWALLVGLAMLRAKFPAPQASAIAPD